MYRFNHNLFRTRPHRRAFTLVEVSAGLALLALILSSVMVLMNRYVDTVVDLGLREEAFEVARGNMEQLLSEAKLSDTVEFGDSELNPEIEWQTLVEPFYEPVTDRMWVRAVCSAGFTDSKGEFQNIELEHWITDLSAAQVKQIVAQQQVEEEYMGLLAGGEESAIQETTTAFLEQEGLDAEAYKRLIEQQKREKIEYINEHGFDKYDEYLETLKAEENELLEELGMDFDRYNVFAATYVPRSTFTGMPDSSSGDYGSGDSGSDPSGETGTGRETDNPNNDYGIDWDRIPAELVPLIEQLLGIKKPA
ncbi:MAG: prepilin-type N-terminal cleavage/methylation domain-containing protein [Planctomycetota bacterium]|jgi:prepilin-type N-terminal cleavage/methylation domain-containing protein